MCVQPKYLTFSFSSTDVHGENTGTVCKQTFVLNYRLVFVLNEDNKREKYVYFVSFFV